MTRQQQRLFRLQGLCLLLSRDFASASLGLPAPQSAARGLLCGSEGGLWAHFRMRGPGGEVRGGYTLCLPTRHTIGSISGYLFSQPLLATPPPHVLLRLRHGRLQHSDSLSDSAVRENSRARSPADTAKTRPVGHRLFALSRALFIGQSDVHRKDGAPGGTPSSIFRGCVFPY